MTRRPEPRLVGVAAGLLRPAALCLLLLLALHAVPCAAAAADKPVLPTHEAATTAPAHASPSFDVLLAQRLEALRAHRRAIQDALPRAPDEVATALGRLVREEPPGQLILAFVKLAAILVLASLAERLFIRMMRRLRRRVLDASEATVAARVAKVGLRLVLVALSVLVFSAVAFGGFLAFDWPPLLEPVVSRFLGATVLLRLISIVVRVLLAPTLPHLRLSPIDDAQARFWDRRLYAFTAIFLFGYATVTSLVDARHLGARARDRGPSAGPGPRRGGHRERLAAAARGRRPGRASGSSGCGRPGGGRRAERGRAHRGRAGRARPPGWRPSPCARHHGGTLRRGALGAVGHRRHAGLHDPALVAGLLPIAHPGGPGLGQPSARPVGVDRSSRTGRRACWRRRSSAASA